MDSDGVVTSAATLQAQRTTTADDEIDDAVAELDAAGRIESAR